MSEEPRIELHGTACSCRGGAWMLLEDASQSPCSGGASGAAEKRVVSLNEWRQLGKPGNLEAYLALQARVENGERRQFQRFVVQLPVRLERIPSWRDPTTQGEDAVSEVLASGGALVRSGMAVEKGETIRFRLATFESRAEVMYVSRVGNPDGLQRLGLKFLDALLPDALIPADATPVG